MAIRASVLIDCLEVTCIAFYIEIAIAGGEIRFKIQYVTNPAALSGLTEFGYRGFGGSDAHIVSHIGRCVTRFADELRSMDDLVSALQAGRFEAESWRST